MSTLQRKPNRGLVMFVPFFSYILLRSTALVWHEGTKSQSVKIHNRTTNYCPNILLWSGLPSYAGQALASAGPDLKHFWGPHSVVCRHFWGGALRSRMMIEISDVTKVRPEKVTPRPLQQIIQWTGYALRKPIHD